MMFEETLPPGTTSLHHLHHDSDKVASVAGQFSFMIGDEVTVGGSGTCAFMPRDTPHAWKNIGNETGRVLFFYTPAAAGGVIEAMSEGRPMDEEERRKLYERHRWEVVGPNLL
jgi:quercetin dioxygenase-like cupin family protein